MVKSDNAKPTIFLADPFAILSKRFLDEKDQKKLSTALPQFQFLVTYILVRRKFAEQDICLSHVCLPKYIDGSNDISDENPTHFRFRLSLWICTRLVFVWQFFTRNFFSAKSRVCQTSQRHFFVPGSFSLESNLFWARLKLRVRPRIDFRHRHRRH